MEKVSHFFCLFLFLFSSSVEETLHQNSKIEFQTVDYDTSAHDLSSTSSKCRRRVPTNGSLEKGAPLRLDVVHMYGPCAQEGSKGQATAPLTLAEIFAKDKLRVQSIHNAAATANTNKHDHLYYTNNEEDYGPTQLPAHQGESLGTANYVVTIALGTPKHYLTLLIDTGSVLTWTQCESCHPHECYKQHEPLFDPSASRTYSRIPCASPNCAHELGNHKSGGRECLHQNPHCSYIVKYGSGENSTGFYSRDKLSLSLSNVFFGFRFGCGTHNHIVARFAGVLGLGKGLASFVSQTQGTYSGLFSYCLPPDSSSTGFIAFGGQHYYKNIDGMSFTPLVPGPTDHYHIDITAIGVGGYKLPIQDSVFSNSGAIIDSGTVLTRLPPAAYAALTAEFNKQMIELGHASAPAEKYFLDTCFHIKPKAKIPKVSFTFKGGAGFNLAGSGILYHFVSGKSCLAFLSNRNPAALTILGNTQQRTLEFLYDVPNNKLGFRNNPNCL